MESNNTPVTVEEVEALCKEMRELDNEIERDNEAIKVKNKKYMELEAKATRFLKEMGKKSYKSEFGTVTIVEKWRVNNPQTDEDKIKFFDYLKSKGLFEAYATVNSNSLNAYYKQEKEAAIARDPMEALNFSLPGIGEAKLHETISFRKG